MSFCNKSRTFPLPRRFPISQSCPPHIFWKVVTHSSDDIDDFDDDNDDDIDYFGDDDDANLGVWASSSFMRASIPTWLSSSPTVPAARPASENTSYDNDDEDYGENDHGNDCDYVDDYTNKWWLH